MIKPLQAWAIVDIEKLIDPFPVNEECWTYAGEEGKRIGLMAIYDKEPKIPEEWKHIKESDKG